MPGPVVIFLDVDGTLLPFATPGRPAHDAGPEPAPGRPRPGPRSAAAGAAVRPRLGHRLDGWGERGDLAPTGEWLASVRPEAW